MNKALTNLLRLSASHHPLVLSHSQLAEYQDAVSVLSSIGIVNESNPDFWVNCTNCDHAHKADVIDGKYIVVCDVDPDVGAYEVTEEEIKQSKLYYSELCAWIASQLGLSGDIATDDEVIWNLGYMSVSGKRYTFYLLRSTEYSELEKRLSLLGTDYPVMIWLGMHPPTGYFPANVIDIEKFLDLQNGQLVLDQSLIATHLPAKVTTEEGDLLLHEDIVASEANGTHQLKIGLRTDGSFMHTPSITKSQYGLIFNLFHNHQPRTSAEINHSKMYKNDRSITGELGKINKILTEPPINRAKLIISTAGNKYQLNPNLDCMHTTSS